MIDLGSLELRSEEDLVRAHQLVRTVTSRLGFTAFEQTRVATALAEIARNALGYGGGGSVELGVAEERSMLVLTVQDHGPGIADVGAALRGEGPRTGMGLGITGARKLMDAFTLDSTAAGTRVVMDKRLPRRTQPLSLAQVGELRAQLVDGMAGDAQQEVRKLRAEAVRREQRVAELILELTETNRGVMALHAELEDRAEYQRQAAELKTRLLSEMGHELRTPLHSILAVAGFLADHLDGPLNEEQDKQARIVREVATGLTEYVNDLLELARADAGKITVHRGDSTVDELLGTLRRMLQPLARSEAVALEFAPAPALALRTDASKLSQILRNLVANALKFTERGTVAVRVREAPGGDVEFVVHDTGIGIAPEHLEAIFQEFVQVEGPHQAAVRGSGLGLPLSRRLAELLGGSLTVRSTLGEGSAFTLRVPAVYQGEAQETPASVREAHVPGVPLKHGGKLLLVDDDAASRYVLRRWLGDRFEIEEARGGREGLESARSWLPDAIFLDVVMPDLTGFEVLARLGDDPATAHIPVIVYSSLVLGSSDRARLSRAVAILRKSTASRTADRSAVEAALAAAGLTSS